MLHGALNPLKFCLEAIVVEFERLDIVDVSDLVAANERTAVPSHTVAGAANRLEDFFPFDPLTGFKLTAALVAPLYQEWTRRSSEPRDSNLSGVSGVSGSDVERSESLSRSLQGMSVTPGSGGDAYPLHEHMRRRLEENRSTFSIMLTGGPQP